MEVSENGVRFPAALKTNAFEADSAKQQGHGPSRAERTGGEILAAEVQVRHCG